MGNWKERGIRLAAVSEKVLAILGLFGLIYAAINLPDMLMDRLSEKFPKPAVLVTPFCVPLLNTTEKYKDGTKALMELRGFTIETNADISDIRFRIDGNTYISQWAASSDGITPEDMTNLINGLPKGQIKDKSIFGNIPRLMAGKDIVVQFNTVQLDRFNCSSNWFDVSVPGHNVFHRIWPETYYIRELTFSAQPYKFALFTLIFANIIYFVFRRQKKGNKR